MHPHLPWRGAATLLGVLCVGGLLVTPLAQAPRGAAAPACSPIWCVRLSPNPHVERQTTLSIQIGTADFGPGLTLRFTGFLYWRMISQTANCDRLGDIGRTIVGWGNGGDWRYTNFNPGDTCHLTFTLIPDRAGRQALAIRVYPKGSGGGQIDGRSEVKALAWTWADMVKPMDSSHGAPVADLLAQEPAL